MTLLPIQDGIHQEGRAAARRHHLGIVPQTPADKRERKHPPPETVAIASDSAARGPYGADSEQGAHHRSGTVGGKGIRPILQGIPGGHLEGCVWNHPLPG
eukprot:1022356-Amphidinium_carterae.1